MRSAAITVIILVSFLSLFLYQGCGGRAGASADIVNLNGEKIGRALLYEDEGGVKVCLSVKGLSPGVHAFHIHERGDFAPPDFKAAGGHFNPYGKEHGLHNPRGAHAGDMLSIEIAQDGTGSAEVVARGATLKEGEPGSLLREGGTSVIIHEKADDNVTDPTGNAGARIAGGIIRKM